MAESKSWAARMGRSDWQTGSNRPTFEHLEPRLLLDGMSLWGAVADSVEVGSGPVATGVATGPLASGGETTVGLDALSGCSGAMTVCDGALAASDGAERSSVTSVWPARPAAVRIDLGQAAARTRQTPSGPVGHRAAVQAVAAAGADATPPATSFSGEGQTQGWTKTPSDSRLDAGDRLGALRARAPPTSWPRA